MDRKNDSRIAYCGDVPDLRGKKLAVGKKQLKKALLGGTAEAVLLAQNADPAVTAPLAELSEAGHIHITWVPTMAELGKACGIEVGAAAAAVLRLTDGSTGISVE